MLPQTGLEPYPKKITDAKDGAIGERRSEPIEIPRSSKGAGALKIVSEVCMLHADDWMEGIRSEYRGGCPLAVLGVPEVGERLDYSLVQPPKSVGNPSTLPRPQQ